MKPKKKSKKWMIPVGILLVAALLLVPVLGRIAGGGGAGSGGRIKSAAAQLGTVSRTVTGTGTLEFAETEDLSLPDGVAVEEYLVEAGDRVQAGDQIALLDADSIQDALDAASSEAADLDRQLAALPADADRPDPVRSGAAGRVMEILAQPGDSLTDCTLRNGGVVLLSLDGTLRLELPPIPEDSSSKAPKAGDSVSVYLESGTKITGKVLRSGTDGITVTVSDNGKGKPGDTVTCKGKSSLDLGSGTLEIGTPLKTGTGITGIVEEILVEPGDKVEAGDALVRLRNGSAASQREELLQKKEDRLADLQELLDWQAAGVLTAPYAGTIVRTGGTDVCTLAPDSGFTMTISLDELDILSVSQGQPAAVSVTAAGEENLAGEVTWVNTLGTGANGVTKFSVEISVPWAEGMRQGMNASAEITVEQRENCLTLPLEALYQTGARTFVYTAQDEESGELQGDVTVTTGMSDGIRVEITSGLSDGDTVLYQYAEAKDEGGIQSWSDWENATPWADTNPFGGMEGIEQ